jgi:hypothetical protein
MDLVDVYQPTLTANYSERPLKGPHLQVLLSPAHAGVCRPIPALKASIDGVELTRLHGRFTDANFDYDRDCNVYEFEADAAALAKRAVAADGVVSMFDGTATYSVTVKNLFVPRTLRVEGVLQAGKEATMRIVPRGDIVAENPTFQIELSQGDWKERLPAAWLNGGIHFVVPEGKSGDFSLQWLGSSFVQPKVENCAASLCTASRTAPADPLVVTVR